MAKWTSLALVGWVTFTWSMPAIHAAAAPAGGIPSTVTLPMEEYLDLRKRTELPSLTTIEEVTAGGALGKALALRFSGSSTGTPALTDILVDNPNLGLHDCKGDAVFHQHDGNIAIVALAKRFTLECQVSVRSWGNVELKLLKPAFFRSFVSGADAIVDFAEGGASVVLAPAASSKNLAASDSHAEITAVSRYEITVLPADSRFHYGFQLNNPSRGKRHFEIALPNQELIQKVKTQAEYELKGDRAISLELAPGENAVEVTGTYSASAFTRPLATGQQYALIENDPMLQLSVTGKGARLISTRDSGMAPAYASARAYLLGDAGGLSWTAKKLEIFPSLGFSVTGANYLYYLPEHASPIIEGTLHFDNQGTPEIPVAIPGTATYLELDGSPQVLAKDAEGHLLLRLPPGRHRALVQYQGARSSGALLSFVNTPVAKANAILSNVSLTLGLAPKWRVVAASGLSQGHSDFKLAALFGAIAAGFALFFLAGRRKAIAASLGGAVFCLPWLFPWTLLAAILARGVRERARIGAYFHRGWKNRLGVALAGVFILFAVSTLTSIVDGHGSPWRGRVRANDSGSDFNAQAESMDDGAFAKSAPMVALGSSAAVEGRFGAPKKGRAASPNQAPMSVTPPTGGGNPEVGGDPTGAAAQPDYQGLPARVQIPNDLRRFSFHQGMVDEHGEVQITALTVSRACLETLGLILLICAFSITYRERNHFRAELRI